MIFSTLFKYMLLAIAAPIYLLPRVTEIPFGIDAALKYMFGVWYQFSLVMPPLAFLFTYIVVYFGAMLALTILRIILGSRAPEVKS